MLKRLVSDTVYLNDQIFIWQPNATETLLGNEVDNEATMTTIIKNADNIVDNVLDNTIAQEKVHLKC